MNKALRSLIVFWFGTSRAFAREIGVNPVVVSQVVHGYRRLSPEERARWAAALHSMPGALFPVDEPHAVHQVFDGIMAEYRSCTRQRS